MTTPELITILQGIEAGKPWEIDSNCRWCPPCPGKPAVQYLQEGFDIRLAPAKKTVPLEPSDIPPGSVVRWKLPQSGWYSILSVCDEGLWVPTQMDSPLYHWDYLMEKVEILRPGQTQWQPCSKEI